MERSQTQWLLGLGVLLVVLVGVLAAQGERSTQTSDSGLVPVWNVDPTAIERIWIEREKPDLAFERVGERWRMTAPYASYAEPDRMRALFRLLSVQEGEQVLGAGELSEYGLGDPPVARVRVQLRGGLEQTLVIGDAVPVGFRTYALSKDGLPVAINGDGHQVVQEKAEHFRDHAVFDVDPAQVREVSVWSEQGVLTMRGKGTSWGLDGFGRADPSRVDDVVMGLLALRYDILWEQDTWVENPRFGARLVLADGTEHVFHAGEDGPLGVVSSSSDGRYGTVFPELLIELGRGPTSVADARAFPIDEEDADEIEVTVGDQTVVAVRNGPSWQVSGLAPDVAYERVERLIDATATYQRIPPEGATEGYGQVAIRSSGGTRIVTMGGVEDSYRILRDVAHPTPYRIEEVQLQALLKGLGLRP